MCLTKGIINKIIVTRVHAPMCVHDGASNITDFSNVSLYIARDHDHF